MFGLGGYYQLAVRGQQLHIVQMNVCILPKRMSAFGKEIFDMRVNEYSRTGPLSRLASIPTLAMTRI